MEILKSYKDNELLKRVLYLANSKRIKFYIKQIPKYEQATMVQDLSVALNALDSLSTRLVTGQAAIDHLSETLGFCTADDAYIIERIIEKDCKIGMGTSNINKVFPKLIEDTPYMGAKAFEEKFARAIVAGGAKAFSQLKMDGRYANIIIRGGDVEVESRQGEPTTIDGALFIEELKKFPDCVLNGELTMGGGITRYESNGIIASLVSIGKKILDGEDVTKEKAKFKVKHVMEYQEAMDLIRFTVWDKITVDEYFDMKSSRAYEDRLEDAFRTVYQSNAKMINIVDGKPVNSYEEAMSHFQEVLAKGEEGTILKSAKGAWKDGKPNWQVKMKLEMDVDLKIVGFNYGTGKNAKVISSINAESSCGKVFTRPTGINEEMMQYITDNQDKLMGTIIEVKCSGLSQDSSGNYSLLHPVFKRLRDDKTIADSFEEIQAIENMAKGLITV
jgi:ATP-dependent DNA ligase